MRVFVTGATGFIGSAIVQELLGAGHKVLGLARSDAGAASLKAAGAEIHRGALEDLDSLAKGAAATDAVIHTAFIHDFSKFAENGAVDRRAIEAMGSALAGSGRPLVVTSGTALLAPGRVSTENDRRDATAHAIPRVSEETAVLQIAKGVRASVIRLPPSVHGKGDHGFVPRMISIAREKGVSAYIGDGANRWPALHRLDAAHLYGLALEQAPAGAHYHGIGDEGVPVKEIATVIGKHLNLPLVSKSREEAAEHFGFLGAFLALDCPSSAALTREQLGWRPTQPGLIADLDQGHYFEG